MNSGIKRSKPPKPPITDAEKKKLEYLKKQQELIKKRGKKSPVSGEYLKKQQELAKGRGKKSPVPGTTTLVKVPGKKYIPRDPGKTVKTPKPGDGKKYIPRDPGKK